jgi:hypothetical protein
MELVELHPDCGSASKYPQVNERRTVMKTVVGMFSRPESAYNAVRELEEDGFVKDDMLAMFQTQVVQDYGADFEGAETQITDEESLARRMAIGGLAGLLAGAGVSLIPNLGPVLRSGGLTTTPLVAIAGAGVGAAIGSAVSAFTGLDIAEEEAELYAEGVRRGHLLVGIEAEGPRVNVAANILKNAGALEVHIMRGECGRQEQVSGRMTSPNDQSTGTHCGSA